MLCTHERDPRNAACSQTCGVKQRPQVKDDHCYTWIVDRHDWHGRALADAQMYRCATDGACRCPTANSIGPRSHPLLSNMRPLLDDFPKPFQPITCSATPEYLHTRNCFSAYFGYLFDAAGSGNCQAAASNSILHCMACFRQGFMLVSGDTHLWYGLMSKM